MLTVLTRPFQGRSVPCQHFYLSFQSSFYLVLSLLLLTSCYSVRIASQHSAPEPDLLETSNGFYANKHVIKIDTTIKLSPVNQDFTKFLPCSDKGFYSFEYKVTFGGFLLSAITFGRHRKVKVKYVCVKEN